MGSEMCISDRGIPVDYYKQALKFEVVSNITDVGVTRIPHKWELHI